MKPKRKAPPAAHLADAEVRANLAALFRESVKGIKSNHARMERAWAAVDSLPITSFKDASAFFRASAAAASAAALALNSLRPFVDLTEMKNDELPTFKIVAMTNSECASLRDQQAIEDEAIYGPTASETDDDDGEVQDES